MTLPDCMMGPSEPCKGFSELTETALIAAENLRKQLAARDALVQELAEALKNLLDCVWSGKTDIPVNDPDNASLTALIAARYLLDKLERK